MNNIELENILGPLNIVVFTLSDGSRIIGEETVFDFSNGHSQLYGVLEFRELDTQIALLPYVPGTLENIYTFNHSNIISRTQASLNVKFQYWRALIYYHLKDNNNVDDINDNDEIFDNHDVLDNTNQPFKPIKRFDLN